MMFEHDIVIQCISERLNECGNNLNYFLKSKKNLIKANNKQKILYSSVELHVIQVKTQF